MRADKLTSKFQQALAEAQSLALGRDHQFIEPIHVMTALLDQTGGTSRYLLDAAGVNINQLRSRLGEALDQMAQIAGSGGEVHLSRDLDRLLNLTDKYAQQRGDDYISSELYVLAALEDKGTLGKLLKDGDAGRKGIEQAIDALRGGESVNDPNAEEQRQALEKYTIDLTERAEQGKLDPVVGRDDEIRRTHPGIAKTHQEQSRSDWRTGCRQDRNRRRPGTTHSQRRSTRSPENQTPAGAGYELIDSWRQVPRRI